MTPETLASINEHAIADYPREACGLVVIVKGRERYVPCQNLATTASEHFRISREDYTAVDDDGEITAIVHSHPGVSARPSEADRVGCEGWDEFGVPWFIVSVMSDHDTPPAVVETALIEPCGYRAPLVGRTFYHGVLDCWALCRDWYAEEWGLALPNPERPDNWWDDGVSDLYTANLAAAGFVVVWRKGDDGPLPIQPGDMILMQIRSNNLVPNHAAIYIGNGQMLHHRYGKLSSRDVYGGYWQEVTRMIVRHNSRVI
jgi:proteasome lid subunit RPN8/RPN11